MKQILFSYVPLLEAASVAGAMFDATPELVEGLLENHPDGNAKCCLWALRDDRPSPVFVLNRGREIGEHLLRWAEDDPVSWFDLHLRVSGSRYAMALLPDFRKSIDRWKIACQLRNGFPPPPDMESLVIFRPIHFISTGESILQKSGLGAGSGPVSVGIMDASDLDMKDPSSSDFDSILWIGPFEVHVDDPEASNYMRGLFE